MDRAVVDPGVLIAALISRTGAPSFIVRAWLDGQFELIVSPLLLLELETVLLRPKFRPYATLDQVHGYVDQFRRFAMIVPNPPSAVGLTPDPGDDYLVALAQSSAATALVSGVAHLTGLRNVVPPVLSPREFVERLPQGRT